MEDRCYLTLDLFPNLNSTVPKIGYFGVYDGHNGDYVAEFLKRRFHEALSRQLSNQSVNQFISPTLVEAGFVEAAYLIDREIIEADYRRLKAGLHNETLHSEVFGGK
jgi:protein phosphatase